MFVSSNIYNYMSKWIATSDYYSVVQKSLPKWDFVMLYISIRHHPKKTLDVHPWWCRVWRTVRTFIFYFKIHDDQLNYEYTPYSNPSKYFTHSSTKGIETIKYLSIKLYTSLYSNSKALPAWGCSCTCTYYHL